MRRRLRQSFEENEAQAMAAMARRWASTRHVQDMWELLADLEEELSKNAGEGARGISVLVLNNTGAEPLDPETFPAAAMRRGISPPDSLE